MFLESGEPLPADPLILPLPGLNAAGDYELSNVRIVSGGRAVMGVLPEVATLKVIDQVLVTRLVTRPLTLDELREKGIEITSKDYTGFQFSLALRLESEVVNLDFPVVFDRNGVVVPQPIDTTVERAVELLDPRSLPFDEPVTTEDVREQAEGLAASEEELVLIAMFGTDAEELLKKIRERHARGTVLVAEDADAERGERIRELVKIVRFDL